MGRSTLPNDNARIQVNYRTADGALFNIYAQDQADLETALAELAGAHASIVQVGALLHGGAAAAPVVQPAASQVPTTAYAPAQTAPAPQAAAPAAGNGHVCLHGARIFKSGNGAKGPWGAYFCPQPQNATDKCEPEWVKV